MAEDPPLPSGAVSASEEESTGDDEPLEESTPGTSAAPARPPAPAFKASTFILTFLFIMGIWMIFDSSTRIAVAGGVVGIAFWPLFGFSGQYPLATMAIAGVLEMLATAVAYNWATDWVKAAKVAKWSAAFRKVQMAAMRSGKKDRVAALQPHQQELTKLSSEVSFAQLKGMAVTWFLVIAIYTWVYLFLYGWPAGCITGCHQAAAASHIVNLGTATVNLTGNVWIIPVWFLIFTFYTVPFSLLFRRILKHFALRAHAARTPGGAPPEGGALGGSA